jgi:type VI secretion system protein ImpL
MLPRLEAVRAVSDGANAHRAGSTWSMRWGLYQGGIIGDAARAAYVRELDGTLRPNVASRLEERLRDPAPQVESLYQYLKAYLMLGEPSRLEKPQLAFIANDEWTQATNAETAAQLSTHFSALLDEAEGLSPIPVDQTLVAQARTTIRRAEIPRLAYRELRLRFVDDQQSALRLDVASGTGTERVLRRKSGVPLSRPVPGVYTASVFKQVTGRNTDQVVLELLKDRWVLGVGLADLSAGNLAAQVTTVYEDDYIAFWDGVLRDIDVVPLGTLERTQDALEILSRPTSPFRGFLKTVDEQTYLVSPPAPAASSGLTDRLGAIIKQGRQAVGIQQVVAGAKVTMHFAELHRLVTGEAGAAPIDGVIRRLEELQKQVSRMGPQVGGVRSTDASAVAAVGSIAKSLELDAAQLPPEIGSVVAKVAAGTSAATRGGLRGDLGARYRADVVGRCQEIVGKYPFNAASAVDAPLEDFAAMFGPGGTFDEFFKNELVELVDTARRPWVWKRDESGASVGGALPLSQFEAAERIRDAFFRGATGGPAVAFTLFPTNLDDTLARVVLDVHGFPLEYDHGPQRVVSVEWPGKRPGPASVTLEPLKGAGRQVLEQPGPWAWFRLLDATQVQPEAGSDTRFLVSFGRSGASASFRLEAARIRNPFREPLLRNFRCS